MSVDILLTGCEVSLYLAEQFASDLKKSFPKLCIEAVSSNKLLGLFRLLDFRTRQKQKISTIQSSLLLAIVEVHLDRSLVQTLCNI